MDDQKMQIISQLMEELQGLMGHSDDEFGDRLGRPKPESAVVKMDVMGSGEGDEGMSDDEFGDDPDEMLKSRIMKLRG